MDLTKLEFDKVFAVTLPDNGLSEEGQAEVLEYLYNLYDVSPERLKAALPDDWTWEWKVTRGTFAGTLPKRIQNWLYKKYAFKLLPPDVSQVGNICAVNTTKANTFHFDFNRTLDWEAGDFGDGKSCFLNGGKTLAIPLIQGYGGFALRLWSSDEKDRKGLGRGWVLPILFPNGVYDPTRWLTPDALALFNGYGLFKEEYSNHSEWEGEKKTYGQLQTLDYARLLAQYLGASYQRIRLLINGSVKDPLFINNDGLSAVLIGPPEVLLPFRKQRRDSSYRQLNLSWPQTTISKILGTCSYCGKLMPAKPEPAPDGNTYCRNCFAKLFAPCHVCETILDRRTARKIELQSSRNTAYFCPQHLKETTFRCSLCDSTLYIGDRLYYHALRKNLKQHPTRRACCRDCFHDRIVACPTCSRPFYSNQPYKAVPCALCAYREAHPNEEMEDNPTVRIAPDDDREVEEVRRPFPPGLVVKLVFNHDYLVRLGHVTPVLQRELKHQHGLNWDEVELVDNREDEEDNTHIYSFRVKG